MARAARIAVTAADVAIRGITVRGSGQSLIDKNSGIFLDRTADRAVVENDVLMDNLIGVYVDGVRDALVRHSTIHGLHTLRRTERGPSISIWNTPGSRILDNELEGGRDGVFCRHQPAEYDSRQPPARPALRGAFHVHQRQRGRGQYLDRQRRRLRDDVFRSVTAARQRIGRRPRHGLLFNYANGSTIAGNVVRRLARSVCSSTTPTRTVSDNWFEGCSIGIHFTAGSERNDDQRQRFRRQSNAGDVCRHPFSRLVERGARELLERQPGLRPQWRRHRRHRVPPERHRRSGGLARTRRKAVAQQPAVQVVRWAQAQFPAIHPGGVLDSAPLMRPVRPPALAELGPPR